MNFDQVEHGKTYNHPTGHFQMILKEKSKECTCFDTGEQYYSATFRPINLNRNMEFLKGETFTYLFWKHDNFNSLTLKN